MTEQRKKRGVPFTARAGLFFIAFVLLLAGGIKAYEYFHAEPTYEGQTLTKWVAKLDSSDPATRELAADAMRHMGRRAVPYLVKWVKPDEERSPIREKVEDWISEHLDVHLHKEKDPYLATRAVEAFKILGPAAKSAIPKLGRMLESWEGTSAAESLAYIGPDSFPELTNALASTNADKRCNALFAVGEMGIQAQAAAPLVEKLTRDPDWNVEREAIEDLGEFGHSATPYVPELKQMLLSNYHPREAAISLAGLGHTNELLCELTNELPAIRWACAKALIGKLNGLQTNYSHGIYGIINIATDPNVGSLSSSPRMRNSVDEAMTWVMVDYLKVGDAAVRAQAADDLGAFGAKANAAVPYLTQALSDENKEVRRSAAKALKEIDVQFQDGGIVRGPRKSKCIALEFTGHAFAEGGDTILDELTKHHAKASFFLTGDFLRNPEFKPLVERIVKEGHYLGPHSDKHLLYCPWDDSKSTLVTQRVFTNDLWSNRFEINNLTKYKRFIDYWLPPYEHYNQQIADWSGEMHMTLVNFTPGTRSNADYTQESDTNFVSSQAIFDSIVKKEREDPDGLNGFLLLMHLGAGPGRKDKMHARFGELLDYLSAKGYQFVRIDEMLGAGE